MANAIKHISVQRGHDVTRYTLCCFGGAAGQHACLVADALAMTRVFIHPLAGVLSAYGMGLADQVAMRSRAVEARLEGCDLEEIAEALADRGARRAASRRASRRTKIAVERRAHLKYEGTDTALVVPLGPAADMLREFEAAYRKQFSFLMPGRPLIAEAVSVEAIASGRGFRRRSAASAKEKAKPAETVAHVHRRALARRAALPPRGPRPGQPHRRPGDHRRGERHHRGRARVAGERDAAQPPGARAHRSAEEEQRRRSARRSTR